MNLFIPVADIPSKEIVPGFKGRFIHSENLTIAYWEITAGSEIPFHEHVHEMIVNVIEGKLELTIGDDIKLLEYGTVGIIPSHIPHRARAVTDCKVLDIFYPVREDYK